MPDLLEKNKGEPTSTGMIDENQTGTISGSDVVSGGETKGALGLDDDSQGVSDEEKPLTPEQEAKIKRDNSESKKNDVKRQCLIALKYCIFVLSSVIGLAIVFYVVVWGYNVNSIAEPIGGIKSDIQNLKDYRDNDVKPAINQINEIAGKVEVLLDRR